MVVAALSFVWLLALPVDFTYWQFAAALLVNGLGMGLFASPNRAGIMNALPPNRRGVGAGMSTTFQNSAMVLSIGIFFSLMVTGLAGALPQAMASGLTAHGASQAQAQQAGRAAPGGGACSPRCSGYNPIQSLLGPTASSP